jgi:cytochrome c oxidase cbb3-type subunit I/II
MPSYENLLTAKLNFGTIQQRVQAAAFLGAPYDRELTEADQMAREQAKQIAEGIVRQNGPAGLEDKMVVAVVAYLQRLGKDLFAPPPAPSPAAPAAPAKPVATTASVESKEKP